jgi:hypothetical protein
MKPTAPEWFRSSISAHLALLPLRKNGVRDTIDFIAYSYPKTASAAKDEAFKSSQGPTLPIEALQQASRLLSSVPRTMAPEDYFARLAPQLLSLLDGDAGKEISRATAFVVSSGILGKRAFGAPGTIGWKLFAEPLLNTFNPPATKPARKRKANSDDPLLDQQLISQANLSSTLNRLSALIGSHPNPGLTGRLLKPLLLPLWGLVNYDKSPIVEAEWSEPALNLLDVFFKLSGNITHLTVLTDNLLWDGISDWEYGPSSEGGVAIRERGKQSSNSVNIVEAIPRIDRRVVTLVHLLSSVSDETVGSAFLHLSKKWLLPQTQQGPQQLQVEASPLDSLAQAKLVQEILEKYQDIISKQPNQMLALILQILQQHEETLKMDAERRRGLQHPTYSSLSNIVSHESNSSREEPQLGTGTDAEEMLSVAVSLLNTILTNTEFTSGKETITTIANIRRLLTSFSGDHSQILSPTLRMSIKSSQLLITEALSSESSNSGPQQGGTAPAHDIHQTLNEIANDLASDLPPLRNSGLHALQALIKTTDITIDVPTVALLILKTIRTDTEEFVYLAGIRTLVELGLRRDLGFTVKLTTDAFQDAKEEAGVDGRLRIGEALNSLIGATAEPYTKISLVDEGIAIRGIADVLISVAGRRGKRNREVQERQQRDRLEKRRQREAQRAWGGDIPDLPSDDEEEERLADPLEKEKKRKDLEAIEKIVKGWEDTGFSEDLRIRTSALSILSSLLEKSLDSCTSSIVNSATEIALSILSLEQGSEQTILRRAAALVFFSILRAMDIAHDEGREVAVGLDAEKWMDVERVLRWVVSEDADDLVKGHAGAVLEGLEAWRMKRLFGAKVDGAIQGIGLEGGLRGLDVNPGVDSTRSAGLKIEEIE